MSAWMRSFTQDLSDSRVARVNCSIAEDAVYTALLTTRYTCDNSTLRMLPSFSEAWMISFRVLVQLVRPITKTEMLADLAELGFGNLSDGGEPGRIVYQRAPHESYGLRRAGVGHGAQEIG
jgi:hypothetical protein